MSADRLAMTTSKSGFGKIVADSRVITWRNLKRIPRIPELAIFAIFQSIMFVLLFAFVFGGAIPLPGYPDPGAYRQYLLPGVFAQTIASEHPVLLSLIWIALILAIFAPLGVRRYRSMSR